MNYNDYDEDILNEEENDMNDEFESDINEFNEILNYTSFNTLNSIFFK